MRPLALAAAAALLAGCSLNYVDTTFKATKPFKHAMPGEEGHEGHGGGEKVAERSAEAKPEAPSNLGSPNVPAMSDSRALGRTYAVFPNDAPPSGMAPDHVRPGGGE